MKDTAPICTSKPVPDGIKIPCGKSCCVEKVSHTIDNLSINSLSSKNFSLQLNTSDYTGERHEPLRHTQLFAYKYYHYFKQQIDYLNYSIKHSALPPYTFWFPFKYLHANENRATAPTQFRIYIENLLIASFKTLIFPRWPFTKNCCGNPTALVGFK